MNVLIAFLMKYREKIGHRIDFAIPHSKHCNWLKIVLLIMHAGSRICALRGGIFPPN